MLKMLPELLQISYCCSFNTTLPGMALYPQLLQISTILHNDYVYGFGEHRHTSFRHDMNYRKWAIFTRDAGPNVSLAIVEASSGCCVLCYTRDVTYCRSVEVPYFVLAMEAQIVVIFVIHVMR